MHDAARDYIATHAADCQAPVLEIGSRDINGTVRDLLPRQGYLGIDLMEGPGVDVVGDVCRDLRPAEPTFETVICCEVLEHAENPQAILAAAHEHLRKGGILLLTAAGPDRTPHSAIDGGAVRSSEHYANIDPADLRDWLIEAGFAWSQIDVLGDDVRAKAIK